MSYSGDAAEQVVRMSLETGEVAVRLAGSGAKQLAILLYAVLRDEGKTKGQVRLSHMLRSGKELKVFAVKDSELRLFCREARKYGVLYCVLKDKHAKDGLTDIMARAEDAGKISRIMERFGLSTVDMAQVKHEETPERQEAAEKAPAPGLGPDVDALLDSLLAPPQTEASAPTQGPSPQGAPSDAASEPSAIPAQEAPDRDEATFWAAVLGKEGGQNPPMGSPQTPASLSQEKEGRSGRPHLSGPISGRKEDAADIERGQNRPSVRQELREIREQQQKRAQKREPPALQRAQPKKKSKKKER